MKFLVQEHIFTALCFTALHRCWGFYRLKARPSATTTIPTRFTVVVRRWASDVSKVCRHVAASALGPLRASLTFIFTTAPWAGTVAAPALQARNARLREVYIHVALSVQTKHHTHPVLGKRERLSSVNRHGMGWLDGRKNKTRAPAWAGENHWRSASIL